MGLVAAAGTALAGIGSAIGAGVGAIGAGLGTAAGATLGAGALGAAGAIGSSLINSNAASSAANAQVDQAKNALGLQKAEFQTTQANLQPYLSAGQGALTQYGNLIGSNGGAAQQTAINGLLTNPLYTSLINQGNQAILANASATGGLRSGNANYNLANFDANTLAQVYQSQIGNLGNLVGAGQNAAVGLGGFGAGYANSASNVLSQIGSAQAGGILGSTGALTGGINSGLSQLLGGISGYSALGGFSGAGGVAQSIYNASQPTLGAGVGLGTSISGGDPYANPITVI